MAKSLAIFTMFYVSLVISQARAEEPTLAKELAGLQPVIGKVFRGEFSNSTPEKPMVDISSYERVLNGKAVRMLHSVNDGQYGGETIFMWDDQQKKVVYWYFTTAGFTTQGTLELGKNQWTSLEEVKGNANGITKVRATTTLKDDGGLHVKSEYYTGEKWTPGHEVNYAPSKDAKVVFK